MHKIAILTAIASLLLWQIACNTEKSGRLVTYPAPEGEPASEDFTLKVNNEDVFVYRARVSAWPINQVWPGYQRPIDQTELASFSYFDCSGRVSIELTAARDFGSVIVRPISCGIVPEVEGRVIRFEMEGPGQVVVELDDYHHAFHLFANPLEKEKPDPGDPAVHYFGPGIHEAGQIEMKDGETVYIEGGAIVHGVIVGRDVSDIRIAGRGILDASKIGRFDAPQMVSVYGCENVVVEGIICRDPHVWTVLPGKCRKVRISNIKLIGLWRYNADGIDIVNSQDVLIEDCFIRAFDDNIALKGMRWQNNLTEERNLKNIHVHNCVLWNDWGRAFEIGAETVADSITDVLFEDCDVIHYVHIAMDVQNGDRAVVRNVEFRDIRVEEPIKDSARIAERPYPKDRLGYLIDLNIRANPYSKDTIRGKIQHISYESISYSGTPFPVSVMNGFSPEHLVEGVRLKDIEIRGETIESTEALRLQANEFVKDVEFK
jgi:hypothetical protein